MATAVAINIDPMGIEWGSAAALTFDPSATSLAVQGSDDGGSAVALWETDVSFINGTTDTDRSISDATPLFDLTLLDYSLGSADPIAFVFFDIFSDNIVDSLGRSGIGAVTQDLLDNLIFSSDGQLGFNTDWSFTVGIPGDPTQSTIFVNDVAMVAVQTVSEPDTLFLALLGLLAWGLPNVKRAGRTCLR